MNETPAEEKTTGPAAELARERLENELLVTRCQLGERAALDLLVARWHPVLWRYVRGLTGDPAVAEEILQDAWLRILRGLDRLREPARLPSWLFTIVRRSFTDRLRERYGEAVLEPLEADPADEDPASELSWDESESLHQALQKLPLPDREAVVLFYLRELDLRAVAELLAVPVGTVKSRLHRARRTLRELLRTQGVTR